MSPTTTLQAHIAYELVDDHNPDVLVIEFLSDEIAGPSQAHELREELDSLIRPELRHRFVIDFGNLQRLGSTAFGEIVSFAQKAGRLVVCNMRENLRVGAALSGLDLCADFAANRRVAIRAARRAARRALEDTLDYPASSPESGETAGQTSGSRRSGASDSRRFSYVKLVDGDAGCSADAKKVTVPSLTETAAARLTLDDFGGRSDAPGG